MAHMHEARFSLSGQPPLIVSLGHDALERHCSGLRPIRRCGSQLHVGQRCSTARYPSYQAPLHHRLHHLHSPFRQDAGVHRMQEVVDPKARGIRAPVSSSSRHVMHCFCRPYEELQPGDVFIKHMQHSLQHNPRLSITQLSLYLQLTPR